MDGSGNMEIAISRDLGAGDRDLRALQRAAFQGLFRARSVRSKMNFCPISFAWGFQGVKFPVSSVHTVVHSSKFRVNFKRLRLQSAFLLFEVFWGQRVDLALREGKRGTLHPSLNTWGVL